MSFLSYRGKIYEYFEEITKIPRHTGHEEAIGDYILKCNQVRNHEYIRDEYGNILVYVNATEGYEDEPVIILQTHLDMIYEQDSDSDRDLTTESFDLLYSNLELYAEGSSLGARSAFGIAAMLDIMNDEKLNHPALQLLFTAKRYNDMEGARNFDVSKLYGSRHILISITGTGGVELGVGKNLKGENLSRKPVSHDWSYGFELPVCVKASVLKHIFYTYELISCYEDNEVDILKNKIESYASEHDEDICFDAMIMGPTVMNPDTPLERTSPSYFESAQTLLWGLLSSPESYSEYQRFIKYMNGEDDDEYSEDEDGTDEDIDDTDDEDWNRVMSILGLDEDTDKILLRLSYHFAPQDRRNVEDMPMHTYVRTFFEGFFEDEIVEVVKDTDSGFSCTIAGESKDYIEDWVAKLAPVIDLCKSSFYSITELDTEVKDDFIRSRIEKQERDDNLEDCLKRINSLVGVENFKKLCNDIARISAGENAKYLKRFFERCAVCFSINGGDGYSTLIELFSELVKYCGLKEITLYDGIPEAKKALSYNGMINWQIENTAENEPLSFDLTFKMEDTESEDFRNFIRELNEQRGNSLLFFKIPYSEAREKERMRAALSSTYPLLMIDIPPFSTKEYLEQAEDVFGDLGFKVDPDARDMLESFIIDKRNKDHFYGLLSITELVKDVIYQKSANEAGKEKEMSLLIKKQDLVSMEKRYKADKCGVESLDDMIGVDEIRQRIDEIVVQLELAREMPYEKRPGMHMMFTGGPGTGKTTVARVLGQILKEKGLLSKGQFYERSGRELVGRYIGETAPITNALCRDAYGSVLFIDEAYTLFRSTDNDRDFGREALDALVTQMENHRQDFIVIFAGYPDEIKMMLESNPGLQSRIPYEIKFRNFKRDELARIYMNMVRGSYDYGNDLEDAVNSFFTSLKDEILSDKAFSNARFVRNLFERTVSKAALRIQAQTGERIRGDMICILAKDFENTVETEEFKSLLEKKQRTMGFV